MDHQRLLRMATLLIILLPVAATVYGDSIPYEGTDFVTVPVRVTLPDGAPAAHTTITLRSMDRQMLRYGIMGYGWEPVITDAQGSATLHYPTRVVALQSPHNGWPIMPIYATIDPAAGYAGSITTPPSGGSPDHIAQIKLDEGYTLHGNVAQPGGEALTSASVSINHDLHAQSHTGHGGEIWNRETSTDSDGNFTFTHVNSSPVTVKVQYHPDQYWAATTINGQRHEDCVDEYQPEWNNAENRMIIHMEESPAKTFEGIAVDAKGKPVAGAKVTIGYSWHREEKTWGDSHTWETTTTLADGTWRLEIPTKWVNWGSIRKAGKPAPTAGAAFIELSGAINLEITASQTVRLLPDKSDSLMPAR